jgi:Tol biopolymer transport system component
MRDSVRFFRPVWTLLALGAVACQDQATAPEAVEQAHGTVANNAGPGTEPQPLPVPRIAFISTDGASGLEVFTIKRTGDGLTRLTNVVGEHIWDVEWSPAGPSRLAFHTYDRLYVISADGTGLQNLTPDWTTELSDLEWSPDGTRLAVRDRSPTTNAKTIKVMNADGSGVVQLAWDPEEISPPAWSPDGQRLMYSTRTDLARTLFNDRGVWTIKPDGTGRTKVHSVSGSIYDTFQYSPDGTKVVICRDGQAVVMKVDGTGLTSLGVGCYSESGPQWSPNGTRLLTSYVVGNLEQVFVIDADGTDKVQLTSASVHSDEAMWSREGGWIAFRRGLTGGTMDLWVMKADGSAKTQLTAGMELEVAVSWGPQPAIFP